MTHTGHTSKHGTQTAQDRIVPRDVFTKTNKLSSHDVAVGGRLVTHDTGTGMERIHSHDKSVGGHTSRHDIGVGGERHSHFGIGVDAGTTPDKIAPRDAATGTNKLSTHSVAVGGKMLTHDTGTGMERVHGHDRGVGSHASTHEVGVGNDRRSHHDIGVDATAVPVKTQDTSAGTVTFTANTGRSPTNIQKLDRSVSAKKIEQPKKIEFRNADTASTADRIRLEDISTQYDIPRQHPAPEIKGNTDTYHCFASHSV